jgi:hypothetical protein
MVSFAPRHTAPPHSTQSKPSNTSSWGWISSMAFHPQAVRTGVPAAQQFSVSLPPHVKTRDHFFVF